MDVLCSKGLSAKKKKSLYFSECGTKIYKGPAIPRLKAEAESRGMLVRPTAAGKGTLGQTGTVHVLSGSSPPPLPVPSSPLKG